MSVFLANFCGVIACRAEWGERERLRLGAGSDSDLTLDGFGSCFTGGSTSAADEELVLEDDIFLSEAMSSVALESVGIEHSGDFLAGRFILLVVRRLIGAAASDSLLDESSSEVESDSCCFVTTPFASSDSLDVELSEEEVATAVFFETVAFAGSFAAFDGLLATFTLMLFFSAPTFVFLAGGTFPSSDEEASDVDSETEVSGELALRFDFEFRALAVGFGGSALALVVSFSSSASLSELEDDADVDGGVALAIFMLVFILGATLFFCGRASLSSLSSLPLLLDVSSSFSCCLLTFDFCDFDVCFSLSSEPPSSLLLALSSDSLAN